MHDYLFDIETVRLAIIVGVALTMVFYERLHLTTGGAIVPGYLALFVPTPLFIAATLAIGVATYWTVKYVIGRRFILYGRKRFETEILTALAYVTVLMVVAHLLSDLHPYLMAIVGIGFIIPGIIAHDMERQTPLKTIGILLINTAVIVAFMFVFQALLQDLPGRDADAPPFLEPTAYPADLLLLGIIVSVVAGMVLYRTVDIRSGGFVTGAYLAFVLLRPADVVFALIVGLITYLIVTQFMMRTMMIFGRRKFSAMILVGALTAWGAELLVVLTTGYLPWQGFNVIVLVVPALLANDSERQGIPKTLAGAAVTTACVFLIVNAVAYVRGLELPT